MVLKPIHGAVLFAVGLVLMAANLPDVLRTLLTTHIDGGLGSIIGGFFAVVAVGCAARTGFAAQLRQAELEAKAEQARRELEQRDLAAVLRSELEVCHFEVTVFIAALNKDIERSYEQKKYMAWPSVSVRVYEANLANIIILPPVISSNVIGIFHRLCRMQELNCERTFKIPDLQHRVSILDAHQQQISSAVALLKGFEEKKDGTYMLAQFSAAPIDLTER